MTDAKGKLTAFPTFSRWTQWEDRNQLPGSDQPGVYLLGRFDGNPPEQSSPSDASVICIAETHAQSLVRRWNQFHYCAFQQGVGHSEGGTFSRIYLGGEIAEVPAWLYVSAAPLGWEAPDIQDQVQGCKRALLQEYRQLHGRLPACNSKT